MTRVGGWRVHPVLSVAILLGLMLINYVLNLVVIGIPAARFLHMKVGALRRDLVLFTLFVQISSCRSLTERAQLPDSSSASQSSRPLVSQVNGRWGSGLFLALR